MSPTASTRPSIFLRAEQAARRIDVATAGPLAIVVVAAIVLRFSTIDQQSYWDDEGYTIDIMRLRFADVFERVREIESAPPLYYVDAWLWSRVFGIGEIGLRSLSALCGAASVVVLYAAAKDLISRRAGLITAALVATNPLLVWYSQEARVYALHVLMTSLTFLFFIRALDERGLRNLIWWASSSAIALGTFYFAAFPIAAQALWLLAKRRRDAIVPIAAVGSAGLLLLPLAILQSQKDFGFTADTLLTRIAQVPVQFLVGFGVWAEPAGKVAVGVAAASVIAAVAFLSRRDVARERRAAFLAAAIAAFAGGIPVAMALVGADYLSTRKVIAALVPFLVVLGAGFAAGRRLGSIFAATLCVIGIAINIAVAADPQFHRADLRGAAAALGPQHGQRAIVLSPKSMLRTYVPRLADLPRRGVYVRELAIIGMAIKEPGKRPTVPRVLLSPVPAEFGELARINGEKFTVIRFRSSVPTLVRPGELVQSRLGDWPARRVDLLVQAPPLAR